MATLNLHKHENHKNAQGCWNHGLFQCFVDFIDWFKKHINILPTT